MRVSNSIKIRGKGFVVKRGKKICYICKENRRFNVRQGKK